MTTTKKETKMNGVTTIDGEFETDDRAILFAEEAEREYAHVQAEIEREFRESLSDDEHAFFFGSVID